MPPWVARVPQKMPLLHGRAIERLPFAFRSRRHHHTGIQSPAPPRPLLPTTPRLSNDSSSRLYAAARSHAAHCCLVARRAASTNVSPTAINLRPNIPPRNKDLYDALSALSSAAETYVNISRLQLALHGLATHDAVTRVVVLGLNNQTGAQRLARLLLADPLGAEATWERELVGSGDRPVLLKYGEEDDSHRPTPLYKVLSVPSRMLQKYNLEVLVSTLNVNIAPAAASTSTESSKETVLVPKLHATSARGTPVPYPVHKALVFGEGLDSAVEFGRFTADSVADIRAMVKIAADLPVPLQDADPNVQSGSTPVNVEVGTHALANFRESVANSKIFERGWFRSGLPGLLKWLSHDLQPAEPIKPAMKALITSVVDDVETMVAKEDAERLQKLASIPTDPELSAMIIGHLENWAEKSHTELRDELDEAFSTNAWHKLAWWKLFWRVDDVSMISSELLERRWLVSAEKNSIYLAGRMNQAGFPEDTRGLQIDEAPSTSEETVPTAEQPLTGISTDVREQKPWSEQITVARSQLINDMVPGLQALAQRLVVSTFSTTAISSAISTLIYLSSTSLSIFEASAIAALGLTFSLRRMQKMWEVGRSKWQGTVREEGRRTLKSTEEMVRLIIKSKDGPKLVVDDSVSERKAAREAVEKVRLALRKMEDRV